MTHDEYEVFIEEARGTLERLKTFPWAARDYGDANHPEDTRAGRNSGQPILESSP